MDDRNAQVGWTEAQWNRVREEVLRAWQSVRVAGSFLPAYGPLPPSTEIVPSEILKSDGTVDDQATAVVLEISLPVTLNRQQVMDEDLSSALLQFRRRATQVGQLEDWYIFNGTYPITGLRQSMRYLPSYRFLDDLASGERPFLTASEPIADRPTQIRGLLKRNPGALGLLEGARAAEEGEDAAGSPRITELAARAADNQGLMRAVVDAINSLEDYGYVAPYVCVFGRLPFERAHRPIGTSIAFPRDRLEPLIGRELLHASAIDVIPREFPEYPRPTAEAWQSRGVLLSLAGDAVDLAIAAEATPEFRQVDVDGRYVFSVFERFTLRIKDPKCIVPLLFTP